jgi:D-glycero-beta-D-manno-heptose-7-phosphate kinase
MTTNLVLPAVGTGKVLVVGDVMLDRYWFGEVERISPEAPVPVVKVGRMEDRPGGAANVARNVAALGAPTTLLSVIGSDEPGNSLSQLMTESSVDASLHIDPAISTTVKLRVIGRQQQLLRIDFETAPSHEVLKAKLLEYDKRVQQAEVVILSDYGKGGLAHIDAMIRKGNEAGKSIFIDPKGDEYERYRGATVLTPNRAELRQVVGKWSSEAELEDKAQTLRRKLGLEALLLTRSEEGMSLFTEGGVIHEPASAREVYDVSGAGDTVIATLAAMRAGGKSWVEAMRIANVAAGIVVGKLGTAVCSRAELEAALA